MAKPTLTAQPRTETGNGPVGRLRREGIVPGVLYDKPGESIAFKVSRHELTLALNQGGGKENGVELTIGDDSPVSVELVDWQRHPVRGELTHVDFRRA